MSSRKEILKALILSEEDTLKRFKELVEKSVQLFRIDGKNGSIVFENQEFTNAEKICLLLISKYFAKELEIVQENSMSSGSMADELLIKVTTLSAPLGKLVESGYASNNNGSYSVNHYKINEILDSLNTKYATIDTETTSGLKLKSSSTRKQSKSSQDDPKTAKEAGADSTSTRKSTRSRKKITSKIDVPEIKFSQNPSGLDDFAKDLDSSKEKLKKVFEFEENKIHLLTKKHDNKDSQESFLNSIIYLTAFYYYFNRREIDKDSMIKSLSDADVPTGNNFKRDMKNSKRRPFILDKGSNYKITEEGIKLGISLIKEMI